MKRVKDRSPAGAFAALLVGSAIEAALDSGIDIDFLAVQRYKVDEKGHNIPTRSARSRLLASTVANLRAYLVGQSQNVVNGVS